MYNVGNLLNKDWGVGKFVNSNRILVASGVDAAGVPQVQYNNFDAKNSPRTATFADGTIFGLDTYRGQFTFRYIFK